MTDSDFRAVSEEIDLVIPHDRARHDRTSYDCASDGRVSYDHAVCMS